MPKYQAVINNRSFEIVSDEGLLSVNGEPVKCSLEPIGNGLYSLLIRNQSLPVFVQPMDGGQMKITIQGRSSVVQVKDEKDLLLEKFGVKHGKDAVAANLKAPMPGLVLRVYVEAGQTVKAGDRLLVLEAMKMENEIKATADARIKAVQVKPGDAVGKNAVLISFEKD
ncbi:MAG TPA: acetyl-CoA carboxylase biotin carboxyl carrier protein subunit [Rhodothermales bacterium]|nr:acetyl-CoA carboxylase biotin carboxyl carrier protein subunit [Rhodothermales bacterium]